MEKQARDKMVKIGTFGIEIECYNVNRNDLVQAMTANGIDCQNEYYNHNTRNHWKVINDASIRGIAGCEFVSPILNGKNGFDQIKRVCNALAQVNAKINSSCGLHVHHDASDFDRTQLFKAVKVYQRMEKHIDSMMPKSRRENNNRFCQTVVGLKESEIAQPGCNRYRKINLQSFFRHGTIEFRHHSGTVEAAKIINWVLFTGLIVDKARGRVSSDKELARWVDVKWFLGVTTDRIDDAFKKMVKFYENRRRAFGPAA